MYFEVVIVQVGEELEGCDQVRFVMYFVGERSGVTVTVICYGCLCGTPYVFDIIPKPQLIMG